MFALLSAEIKLASFRAELARTDKELTRLATWTRGENSEI